MSYMHWFSYTIGAFVPYQEGERALYGGKLSIFAAVGILVVIALALVWLFRKR